MESVDDKPGQGKGHRAAEKIFNRKREVTDKIINRKREIAGNIIHRKGEIAGNIIHRKREIINGFTRRKEHNKEKIRRAAEELFNRYGILRVSINDIAARAQVSPVTIYNLFGSKDKLVVDWATGFGNQFMERLREAWGSSKPYYDRIEDVINMIVDVTEANPALADNDVLNLFEMKQFEESFLAQMRGLFIDFIHQGQREGYLNPDISDEAIEAYIEILVRGMNSSSEVHARTHHDPKLFHDLVLIMLFGFSRPDKLISPRYAFSERKTT